MKEKSLPRVISGLDATALAVGIVIGTGIFAVPGFVARELGAPGPILFAWVLGGVIALCGALTYAEVAALFPSQGGGFLYVLRAFGPFAAFFKGWGSFLVGYPASCAGIATIFGIYFAEITSGGPRTIKIAAIGAAILAWLLNLRGTRFSASLQTGLTLVKVGALGTLAILALAVGPGSFDRLTFTTGDPWPVAGAFAAALVGILWTYDGWQNLAVVSGEIGNPGRDIVRGLMASIAIVIAIYLIVNVGYLVVLPLEELKGTDSAAAAAAQRVLGPAGAKLLASFIVISAFGALFGISIAGPRYFYAMSRSGLFFEAAGRLAPGTSAPRWGASALCALTVFYVVTGSFEQIMGYYVAITLTYNVLSVASIYRLRAKLPDRPRPFRTPGYPVVPAIFIAGALWVMGNEIASSPLRSGLGMALLLASAPTYFWWRRRSAAESVS